MTGRIRIGGRVCAGSTTFSKRSSSSTFDKTELSDPVAEALVLLGIEGPHSIPIPQLIEKVWAMQQPYLITIVVERRRRRRRKVASDPVLPDAE